MLKSLLKDKQPDILQAWRQRIIDSYPADAHKFLKGEKDQFANPVGHSIRQGTAVLLDGLINNLELEHFSEPLDMLIRVRAVQDFSASQAVAFMYHLKQEIRKILTAYLTDSETLQELLELESKLDALTFSAFDIYMECRETVARIRVNEIRNQSAILFEKQNKAVNKNENKDKPSKDGKI